MCAPYFYRRDAENAEVALRVFKKKAQSINIALPPE
jgi:ribosomal protein S21